MNHKIILGIDAGTSYIGLGLCRENLNTGKIERLYTGTINFPFESATSYNNGSESFQTPCAVRRDFRSSRRVRDRKKDVLKKVSDFISEKLKFDKELLHTNIYVLKKKGKNQELNPKELFAVIYNYAKYRGFDFELNEFGDEADKNKASEYKKNANEIIDWCNANRVHGKTVVDYFIDNKINFHRSRLVVDEKTGKENACKSTCCKRRLV